MKTNKRQWNWIVEAVLLAGFLGTFFLDQTGLEFHQWLGIGVGAVALYHLLRHWEWVKAVTGRLAGKTAPRARLYYLIDAGLAAGLALIVGTGVAVSTWVDVALAYRPVLVTAHIAGSVLTLGAILLKVGLHWRWVTATAQQLFGWPRVATAPAAATVDMARRDFLGLMGVLAAAAVFTVGNLADDNGKTVVAENKTADAQVAPATAAEVAATAAPQPTATKSISNTASSGTTASASSQPSSQSSSTASSSTSNCTIRCNRGCSYPGRCRRYADTNNNGKCDLGECM